MSDDPTFFIGRQYQYSSPAGDGRYSMNRASDDGISHEASIPRSMPSTPSRITSRRPTPMARDQMLGAPNRPTHMNTPAASGPFPMSNILYGFRPETGWPGVLFQVFLQGPFVESWKKQKDMQYWISFEGEGAKAMFFEMDSRIALPEIGTKRYILQCVVPDIPTTHGRVPVTLGVYGTGGKTVVPALFIGYFQCRPNDRSIFTYEYNGNVVGLLEWMSQKIPADLDNLSPQNHGEINTECYQPVVVARHGEDPLVQQGEDTQSALYDQYLPQPFEINGHRDSPQAPIKTELAEITQSLSIADRDPEHMFYSHDPQGLPAFSSAGNLSHDEFLHQMGQLHYPQLLESEQSQYGNYEPNYHAVSQVQDPRSTTFHSGNPIRQLQPSPMFNPYPPRPGKGYGRINFKVKPDTLGNYETWTLPERQSNRRIVAFSKQIMGETIHVDCQPISSNEYKENMMTISCIRWVHNPPGEIQHKFAGHCIFTSVDIITLLERLVEHKFTVQEKNRIRRNLEGYKPETVRKEGSTGYFFNQVMTYVSPKTRNIEKDIKVFLWSDITKALRKIVQKYHFNSNAPSLGRPMNTPTSQPFPMMSQPSSSDSLPLPAPPFSFPSQNSSAESLHSRTNSFEDYSQQYAPLHPFMHQGQEFGYLSSPASEIYASPGSISPGTPIAQMAMLPEARFGVRYDNSLEFGDMEFKDDIPREFA